MYLARTQVDYDERKHTIETTEHTLQTEMFVKAQDYFGIGSATELVACSLQFGAIAEGIIDLSIERKNNALVIVAHRLMAALREVEDTETVEAKGTFKAWLIS